MMTWLKRLVLLVVLLALLVGFYLQSVMEWVDAPTHTTNEASVLTVSPGDSVVVVARKLASMGVIEHPEWFRWFSRFDGSASRIKAGEYRLEEGVTPRDILQQLVKGDVTQYSFTIIEGWSYKQLLQMVAKEKQLTEVAADALQEKLQVAHLEGWFLPDTYHFPAGMTGERFLLRAYESMKSVLDEEWEKREKGLPLKNSYEALILASIIEKETGVAEERPEIAAVFINRLRKGMLLQTDPTVIYGMGDRFKGNIRRKDLREDTPYNTYVHKGLPPTPIALPGRAAINAALHPTKSDALFFVAKGDGTHYFSKNLKQHQAAVRKYQLKK